MFSKEWFFNLDNQLRKAGMDSDLKSFDEILYDLQNRKTLSPINFATSAAYVILAGGFSQKTAKIKHEEIIKYLETAGILSNQTDLLHIFNNRNKTAAILKIWQNRDMFSGNYYACKTLADKISYLSKMPHIGKITANHLARNLGEDVVKYDIWIQRLGAVYSGNNKLIQKINNKNLDTDIKINVDEMFCHLVAETGLPRGYIDVVLWKSCQNHIINGI